MADTTTPPPDLDPAAEEAVFYHEAALNASWTGVRLALGALSLGFGCVHLRVLLPEVAELARPVVPGRASTGRSRGSGATVMGLIVVSAAVQTAVLQRIKAGHKAAWLRGAVVALVLGVAAAGLEIWQLLKLPFFPGASGLRQRVHRLLAGVHGHRARRAGVAGDPGHALPGDPGDLASSSSRPPSPRRSRCSGSRPR